MKMNKLYIKSNIVIAILFSLAIASYLIVENTMTYVKQDYFDEKYEASKLTKDALDYIKKYRLKNAVFIDNLNDPNETALIGQKYTQITTGSGSLPIKLSTTNPNFAALVVQLLKDADVKKGDNVAVCMTGSFPALDIATLCAMEVLEVNPIVIMSTTSSSWGANNPDFTVIDMISLLHSSSFFKLKQRYASIGGNQDIGMSLSKKGRQLAVDAIGRNGFQLINNGNLKDNIAERIKIINEEVSKNIKPIKAFINVGGGVASLGSTNNGSAIPSGLTKNLKLRKIPDKLGVVYEMAKQDVPIIHLLHIEKLMKKYDLPKNPIPLPELGSGELFYLYKYNMKIVLAVTFFLFSIIGVFVYIDRKNNKLGDDIISDEIQI